MPMIPLPFAVALLLGVLLIATLRNADEKEVNQPFALLIGVCALQSMLIGLRWGYGISDVRFVLPIVAATIPPLVFAAFVRLTQIETSPIRVWWHAVIPVLVAALVLRWRDAVDWALIAIYVIYAAVLLWRARIGPDVFAQARFEGVNSALLALRWAAAALLASAAIDLLIALRPDGITTPTAAAIIGVANAAGLVVLGLAAGVAARARAPKAFDSAQATPMEFPDERDLVLRIDDAMQGQKLFQDENLNLNRLARKIALPARAISSAINRAHGKNVSQYVNGYRIDEACKLLTATDDPVTSIMLASGFQTKSNFNREFRRITGLSPLEWRAKSRKS